MAAKRRIEPGVADPEEFGARLRPQTLVFQYDARTSAPLTVTCNFSDQTVFSS